MMNINELNAYIERINHEALNHENYKEFFDYSINVCKDYDLKALEGTNDKNLMIQELKYIEIFYHKFCNMLYGVNTKYEFKMDGKNNYDPATDTVYYRFGAFTDLRSNSAYHIMTIFHENRHAMQIKDLLHNTDILAMDPSAIMIAKEILSSDNELYKQNHSSFMIENDANLFAYGYVASIVKQYFPENMQTVYNRIKNENNNIATGLFTDFIDSDEVYINPPSSNLPILYNIDINSKKTITAEDVKNNQVLSFIYNEDGTLKTYFQIISDREKYLNKFKDQNTQVKFSRSSHSYNNEELLTPLDRVNLVYNVIINSNPTLFIEDCIHNKKSTQLIEELNKYPKFFELYKKDFLSILPKYLNIDNTKEFEELSIQINSNELRNVLEKRFEHIMKVEIKNISGIDIDNENENGQLKEIDTLNQEYNYLSGLFDSKKNSEELSSDRYNIIMRYINSKYKGFISSIQQQNVLNSGDDDLEDSYVFDDPVYAELFKNHGMDMASVSEQEEFRRRYEEQKAELNGHSNLENEESVDRIGPRR